MFGTVMISNSTPTSNSNTVANNNNITNNQSKLNHNKNHKNYDNDEMNNILNMNSTNVKSQHQLKTISNIVSAKSYNHQEYASDNEKSDQHTIIMQHRSSKHGIIFCSI
jgi:hypothetical protein